MPTAVQSLEQFKSTYFQECDELLGSLEAHLLEIARTSSPAEPLNAAFRAIHSLKGGATMFGFARLVSFAHTFETALDLARAGKIPLSREFVDKALVATDILSDLAMAARSEKEPPHDHERAAGEAISALCGEAASLRRAPLTPQAVQIAGAENAVADDRKGGLQTYTIIFVPAPELLRRGLEPLTLIRNLKALGKVSAKADLARLPQLRDLDPTSAYMSWKIEIETSAGLKAVREVFEFVSATAHIEIATGPTAVATQSNDAIQQPSLALDRRGTMADRRTNSIRVDLPRVERLVDLVGEITIAQAMVLQHLDQAMVHSNPQLYRALSGLLQLSRSLQDSVMAIRAQPIGTIFGRIPRVVRDCALQLGREVELEMQGEETEIDKTIVEQLADPLMHIVRNAIDHGIEPPHVRRASGKPEKGSVVLRATQRGSRIVVEVCDDGRGIDRPAVHLRAMSIGLVGPDTELSDDEIDNLIFSPGLSTARAVSGISGRGVGMDVVYRNIQQLGGQVNVRSEPGRGTTTTISLPLTLAVLDAMKIKCGGETYLIPLGHIVECLVAKHSDLNIIPGACAVINVRGKQTRVVDIAGQFGLTHRTKGDRIQIVLVEIDDHSVVGIRVDEICGHHQIVVKSIRDHFNNLPGIAGGTILGDGNVALILDVNQLATNQRLPAPRLANITRNKSDLESCGA